MAELDWSNLAFQARKTNVVVVSTYKEGKWSEPVTTSEFNLNLSYKSLNQHYPLFSVLHPLELERTVAILFCYIDIGILYHFGRPVKNFIVLGFLQRSIVDFVIVHFQTCLVGGDKFGEFDDTEKVFIILVFHCRSIGDVTFAHAHDANAGIKHIKDLLGESVVSRIGIGYHTAERLAGSVRIVLGSLFESDVAETDSLLLRVLSVLLRRLTKFVRNL